MTGGDDVFRRTGRLSGKTALVTGAYQGIGRASAVALANAGARVFATDRALPVVPLELLGRIVPILLDVTDDDSVAAAQQQTGNIDILFNCAGIVHNGTVLDCSPEEWSRIFDVNVTGCYRTIRTYLPGMLERGGGSIINMASVASSVKGVPMRSAYSATKAAVIGLTKSISADFAARNVRCNAICPGTVESPSLEARLSAGEGGYDAARSAFVARQPMGRIGQPEEIADLVVYLASAGYTSGAIHVIDGGWSA